MRWWDGISGRESEHTPEAWRATVHGAAESDTTERLNSKNKYSTPFRKNLRQLFFFLNTVITAPPSNPKAKTNFISDLNNYVFFDKQTIKQGGHTNSI